MAKIKWDFNPEVIREDGHYDIAGATLHVAMRQVEALGDIAMALNRIATELQDMRTIMRLREPQFVVMSPPRSPAAGLPLTSQKEVGRDDEEPAS